jgi:hypothetical protein
VKLPKGLCEHVTEIAALCTRKPYDIQMNNSNSHMGLFSYRFKEFGNYDSLYPGGLEGDIDGIRKVIEVVQEESIDSLKRDLETMNEELKKDIVVDGEVIHSNVDILEFESMRNAHLMLHNSLFITIFVFLETRLRYLCKLIEPRANITLNDISGNGIHKYKRYLEKVHLIDFSPMKGEWDLICSYTLLRNRLVHNSSNKIKIVDEKSDYEKLLRLKQKHLVFEKQGGNAYFYITNRKFLDEVLNVVYKFLRYTCLESA